MIPEALALVFPMLSICGVPLFFRWAWRVFILGVR